MDKIYFFYRNQHVINDDIERENTYEYDYPRLGCDMTLIISVY